MKADLFPPLRKTRKFFPHLGKRICGVSRWVDNMSRAVNFARQPTIRIISVLVAVSALASPAIAAVHRTPVQPTSRKSAPTQKAISKPLPIFSFMGQDTETKYDQAPITCKLQSDDRTVNTDGDFDCSDYNDPVVAGNKMRWMSIYYFNGKLYRIFSSGGKWAFGDLLGAFTEKYGEPSSTSVEKWEAKSGATFDNPTVKWKFKGGELELDQMGLDLDTCSFQFRSDINAPPSPKPVVDF